MKYQEAKRAGVSVSDKLDALCRDIEDLKQEVERLTAKLGKTQEAMPRRRRLHL